MGQALYRKYRSKHLAEIVGQPAVITALNNALKNGQISHAYLFTGPRGVGKTSVARILAHEVNNLEYIHDELPIDIIEIDAASNRRIDEIRDLRDKVNIAPVSAKYKVYIIDEVHMLTKEAFNALLKTLEEPPAHVIFILATTEAHKLPETIVSRTQRYNFKLASSKDVKNHLKAIAKKETINIDDESISVIAKHSGGSLRDAISILDQIRHSSSNINAEMVRQSIGLPSDTIIANIIKAYTSNEPKNVISALSSIEDNGVSSNLLASQLIEYLRNSLGQGKPILPAHEIIHLINELLAVESSQRPDLQLEIAIISAQLNRPAKVTSVTTSEAKIENDQSHQQLSVPAQSLKTHSHSKNTPVAIQNSSLNLEQAWPDILATMHHKHTALYGILRLSQPDFSEKEQNKLTLNFNYPFHLKRMNEGKNKQLLAKTITDQGFQPYEIICVNNKHEFSKTEVDEPLPSTINKNNVNNLKAVFGSAEVLEY